MYDQRPIKSKLTITVDCDIIDEIKKLAEEDDRTVSQYINRVLKKYLIGIGHYPERQKGDNAK